MLDTNFTIFYGAGATGKSTLMLSLAESMRKLGLRLAFLGWTPEFKDEAANPEQAHLVTGIKRDFEFVRFLTESRLENSKMMELLSELAGRGQFDYLFVDDICGDYPGQAAADSPESFVSWQAQQDHAYLKSIEEMRVRKVVTYTTYDDFDHQNLTSRLARPEGASAHQIKPTIPWTLDHGVSVDGTEMKDFLQAVERGLKLDSIIGKK